MTAALEGGEWSAAPPGRTLPPGKTRYPFYRRLGGTQGRSGRAQNLIPTGIRPRTVQPVVSRYTNWATRPTYIYIYIYTHINVWHGTLRMLKALDMSQFCLLYLARVISRGLCFLSKKKKPHIACTAYDTLSKTKRVWNATFSRYHTCNWLPFTLVLKKCSNLITAVGIILFIWNHAKFNILLSGPSSKSHCNRQLDGLLVIWLVSQS